MSESALLHDLVEPERDIAAGDILVMLGSHAQLDLALVRLAGPAPEVPA